MKAGYFLFLLLPSFLLGRVYQPVEGSGKLSSVTRTLPSFEEVVLTGKAEVFISQGDESKITIEADDNIIPVILTDVSQNSLSISTKKGGYTTKLPLIYKITTPHLSSLKIHGASNIKSLTPLNSKTFTLSIAGSAEADITLYASQFNLNISGSGRCMAQGNAQSQQITIAGSGAFDGRELQGDNGVVKLTGSGDVMIQAQKELNILLTGSGHVTYYGNPKLKKRLTGSGTIDIGREEKSS